MSHISDSYDQNVDTNPARQDGSPYRGPALWRIHAASALLVVPQFTVATFALVFLVTARGWPAPVAGPVLAVAATAGAALPLAAAALVPVAAMDAIARPG